MAWLVLSSCLACGVFTGLYYLSASPRNLEAGSVFSARALGLRMHSFTWGWSWGSGFLVPCWCHYWPFPSAKPVFSRARLCGSAASKLMLLPTYLPPSPLERSGFHVANRMVGWDSKKMIKKISGRLFLSFPWPYGSPRESWVFSYGKMHPSWWFLPFHGLWPFINLADSWLKGISEAPLCHLPASGTQFVFYASREKSPVAVAVTSPDKCSWRECFILGK